MSKELAKAVEIAQEAGGILTRYFGHGLKVDFKKNEFDPVTQADKESDAFVRDALASAFPNDEILSEENNARPSSYKKRVWMVDPLDGTKDFVAGRPSFSVMIGLLDKNIPKLGVIYNPVTHELFYAERGQGAFHVLEGKTTPLYVSNNQKLDKAVLVTRNAVKGNVRPLDAQIKELGFAGHLAEGSIGLKVGRVVQGKADVYIHTNLLSCKWDTLAPQVMLTEAGGVIRDLEGKELDYTKPSIGWDKYFIAASNIKLLNDVLAQIMLPE